MAEAKKKPTKKPSAKRSVSSSTKPASSRPKKVVSTKSVPAKKTPARRAKPDIIPVQKKRKTTPPKKKTPPPAVKISKKWSSWLTLPSAERVYVFASVFVLIVTTLIWSILSARTQQSNADQLVNPYLMQNAQTFHGAIFPSTHSFLIKFPFFWLVSMLGYTQAAFVGVTTLVVGLTIAALAWLLYRIDRRPFVYGTMLLAVSSILLMVPAQPYAGALLPVNMAMLATRNIEYVLYVGMLLLLARLPGLRRAGFWSALCIGTVLFASDKLFLDIAILAAGLTFLTYGWRKRHNLRDLTASWLLIGLLAALASIALLWAIQHYRITGISQSSASPYVLVHSFKDLALGGLYTIGGILTNFGANPASGALIVRTIPSIAGHGFLSIAGVSYIVNGLLFLASLAAVLFILRWSFTKEKEGSPDGQYHLLATTLIWSSFAAVILFIGSNHYYPVDARYLGITLFAGIISAAVWLRNRNFSPRTLVIVGAIMLISCTFGVVASFRQFDADSTALSTVNARDQIILQDLSKHKVSVLVGDYWRVLPIHNATLGQQNIMPLDSCGQTRQVLTSTVWQPDLNHTRFAYLLSLDGSLTGYSTCTLNQVINQYGRPNASALIAGSVSKPKEVLLFYDRGINRLKRVTAQTLSTIYPIKLTAIPRTPCDKPTIMTIVAHQDDDLLFMNPDLEQSIKAGDCTRTIYVTAGDGGGGEGYWYSREQGSEAAYSVMTGNRQVWVQRNISINSHEYITIDTPRGDTKHTLIFMRLPDGSPSGAGFSSSNYESLLKLYAGAIGTIHTVDKQSSYSKSDLISALYQLMDYYSPTEVRTQADYVGGRYADHSDHMTVGQFATAAFGQYQASLPATQPTASISYFIGYPIHGFPANIFDPALQAKEDAFFAYARFDSGVCNSAQACNNGADIYRYYLTRQYRFDPTTNAVIADSGSGS